MLHICVLRRGKLGGYWSKSLNSEVLRTLPSETKLEEMSDKARNENLRFLTLFLFSTENRTYLSGRFVDKFSIIFRSLFVVKHV